MWVREEEECQAARHEVKCDMSGAWLIECLAFV